MLHRVEYEREGLFEGKKTTVSSDPIQGTLKWQLLGLPISPKLPPVFGPSCMRQNRLRIRFLEVKMKTRTRLQTLFRLIVSISLPWLATMPTSLQCPSDVQEAVARSGRGVRKLSLYTPVGRKAAGEGGGHRAGAAY